MSREEILEKLKEILSSNQFLFSEGQIKEITEDTSLIYDLVMDSIQILELLVAIEEAFNLTYEAEDLSVELFDKVFNLINFVETKMAKMK